jgi:YesN/AraC family two-component response regulator
MSVFDYLQKLRIEEACRLLEERSDKITDIAGQVGYGDYRFFNKTFRKVTGMTAGEYRKKAKRPPSVPTEAPDKE